MTDIAKTLKPGQRITVRAVSPTGKYTSLPLVEVKSGDRIIFTLENTSPTPEPTPTPTPAAGLWIGAQELASRPMTGAAWDSVLASSKASGTGNVADQNSMHDNVALASALAAVRTGNAADRTRAIAALGSAIGTEQGARWLAIGRNLTGYIIAADVLGIRSGPAFDWLKSFQTKKLAHNNSGEPITLKQSAWASGSNASAQEGAVHAALSAYLGDKAGLDWGWTAFRRYCGDRSSPHKMIYNDASWQFKPDDPVGIQDAGATKNGHRLDGAIGNDMSRGGSFAWPPGLTDYPWVGLEGSAAAALIFARAGYPAWTVGSSAIKRALEYLHFVRTQTGTVAWFDDTRSAEVKHVVNVAYGLNLPCKKPTGVGRTFGFTDFTHTDKASVGAG